MPGTEADAGASSAPLDRQLLPSPYKKNRLSRLESASSYSLNYPTRTRRPYARGETHSPNRGNLSINEVVGHRRWRDWCDSPPRPYAVKLKIASRQLSALGGEAKLIDVQSGLHSHDETHSPIKLEYLEYAKSQGYARAHIALIAPEWAGFREDY